MLFIFVILLTPFILWLVHWYYTVNYYEKYLKKIPGQKRKLLFGNALELASSTSVLPRLMESLDEFKGNFKVYIGSQPFLIVCEPKDLEFIMSSTKILRKSEQYSFVHNWIGLGLLTSWGNRWRKHRKIITPAFHFQILEQFIDTFNERGDILVSKLKAETRQSSFNVYPYITRCTLDIICETAMGTTVNAQDDLESEYVKSVNILLGVLTTRSFSPIYANEFIYPFTKMYWKERKALKVVHDYTRSVIRRRKLEYFSSKENGVELADDTFGRKKKQAFLDLLLEYSFKDPSLTDSDIQEEVDTFMFEGHDTTATSITFALYAIATHPDVQKKIFAELQEIFAGDLKRKPTYKDLQEMKYLEMVIKESLRLYTTVPMVGRALEEDVNWNGTLLPKGLMITIFIYGASNSSLFFENPEKFNPDRFNLEESKERNPFTYIPFSAGARNCIGQKFAMLEMKSTISNVLMNYELLPPVPDHQIILKSEAVLKSDNGVFVRLRNRHDG